MDTIFNVVRIFAYSVFGFFGILAFFVAWMYIKDRGK